MLTASVDLSGVEPRLRRTWCTEVRGGRWQMVKRSVLALSTDKCVKELDEFGFASSSRQSVDGFRDAARAHDVPIEAIDVAVEFDRFTAAGLPLLFNGVMGDNLFEYGDGGHSDLRYPVLEALPLGFQGRLELRDLLHRLSQARNDRHVNEPVIDIIDPNLHPLRLPPPSDGDSSWAVSELLFELEHCRDDSRRYELEHRLKTIGHRNLKFSKLPSALQVRALVRWLPAEVDIAADGSCRFVSDINKLPRTDNERLYELLEQLLSSLMPAFGELGQVPFDPSQPPRSLLGHAASIASANESPHASSNDDNDDDDDNDVEDEPDERADAVRNKARARAASGQQTDRQPASSFVAQTRFVPCRRQFVVKAQSVALRPGEAYSGHWHVEGLATEHVSASAVFYVDLAPNLVGGGVRFRPEQVPDHATDFVDTAVVPAKAGRAIVFQNMPHRVRRIENVDERADGPEALRTFVTFFLIDPRTRLTSTADELSPEQRFESEEHARRFRDTLRHAL